MRIGATISGIERRLLDSLSAANAAANQNAIRLATGKKVNKPADDPAAFTRISALDNQLSEVVLAASRVDQATTIAASTQLTVDQILTELGKIKTALLADEDQSLTSTQRDEKQAEIDAALAKINDLAATEIGGRRRLDGSTDFTANGIRDHQIERLEVYDSSAAAEIFGTVTTRAERGRLTYTGLLGQTTSAATFTLTGAEGSTTISVTLSESLSSVAAKINQDSHKTGVTAEAINDTLTFRTVEYGENATIAINVSSGSFNVSGGNGDGTANGVNALATINGVALEGDGNTFVRRHHDVSYRLTFKGGFEGQFAPITVSNQSVDRFSLNTDVSIVDQLGMFGLQTGQLGGLSGSLAELATGGALAGLSTNTSQGLRVIEEAIGQATRAKGRIDGFADSTVGSADTLLDGLKDSLQTALDNLNQVDDDEEEALQAANNVLVQNAVASLAILEQQRTDMLSILRAMAGI